MFSCLIGKSFSQNEISIISEGRYLGKNVYVQNPFDGNESCCCVTEIRVNDKPFLGQINSTAFEVDLASYDLKLQDKYIIKIIHKADCLPKILNPEIIHRKCTFETSKIELIADTLHWYTTNEESPMTFIVEQYRWNKWIKIGEADGFGPNDTENHYSYPIVYNNGLNKFRVKQIDYSGKPCISTSVSLVSAVNPISYTIDTINMTIHFSEKSMFEIFDQDGNMVKKGDNIAVDCSNLERKGLYYLNYDNICGELISFENKNSKHGKHHFRRKSNRN